MPAKTVGSWPKDRTFSEDPWVDLSSLTVVANMACYAVISDPDYMLVGLPKFP